MNAIGKKYEIRDPVHGFIIIDEWERDIINHPVFQRLRRIRQLALTDMVYPGAMHTRFEHSLGVMHVATQMFDQIVSRRKDFLVSELSYSPGGLERDRIIVRLASLLHDVGHAPFSHAAEELMPMDQETNISYKHEHYSGNAIVFAMQDVIENHRFNQNHRIKAQDIADFLNGRATIGRQLLWRGLVTSQLDADRADYLLRDSHHIGVAYGHYDLHRLLSTMTVARHDETDAPTLAVEEGGIHTAEHLIIARYLMFTQVYFQHTRRAYDHHIIGAIKSLLVKIQASSNLENKEVFPSPDCLENVNLYLRWNDWSVLGMIDAGEGGEHGEIIRKRNHYRAVYETREVTQDKDIIFFNKLCEVIGPELAFIDLSKKSWYDPHNEDIMILKDDASGDKATPLSQLSSVVHGLSTVNQYRIYVDPSNRHSSRAKVKSLIQKEGMGNEI
jgi:uncharacterized protein